MFSGKNASGPAVGKFLLFLLGLLGMNLVANAQTDNLMIVKYVDWDSGSGVAVVIWNPTPNPVNLANYEFRIYGNGSNTPTTTSPLKGTLQPCATILVGNDEYKNTNCRNTVSTANFTAFGLGVNGNDVVVLAQTNSQIVDAVGRIGYDTGNNNSQKVSNVTDALYQHTLERAPGNLARYSLTSGQYNPSATNTANIWPNNKTTNVTGWTVSNSACLTNTWASGTATANAGPDLSRPCKSMAPFNLTAAVTGTNVTVQWSGGKGTFSNPNAAITTYTPSPQDFNQIKLTLKATSGCREVTDEVKLLNGDSTQVSGTLTFSPQNPKLGDTVTFTLLTPGGSSSIVGDFNYGDGSPQEIKRGGSKHVYRKSGEFTVKVVPLSLVGCPTDTLTARIVIPEVEPTKPVAIFIPNIITPNNDGRNDAFEPQLPATTAYELKVYNRWGVQIFESTDRNKKWEGRNAAHGVYFVHLKATLTTGEALNYKLPVTLVR